MGARKFQVPIDLSKLELQNAVIHTLASAPSSPVKFQMYGNSGDNTLYWWDGTQWVAAKSSATSFGTITAETAFGTSKNDGVATTFARSDHAHGNPTHVAADHNGIPLSALAAAAANVSMGGFVITNVGNPTNGTDAANKNYVDGAINGLNWKDSCRIASTANLGLSGLAAIDGVTPVANDRILVKNQTTASANGIYLASSGAWSRATDADLGSEMVQLAVFVEEGSTQSDTAWVCTTNAPITIGSTNLTFSQFGAGSTFVAGNGLTLTGNTFDVGAGTGITVAADSVAVDTTVIATRAYADAGASKRYAVDVGGATAVTVTHNLNTNDTIVQVYDKTTPFAQLECDVEHATVNTVILRFAVAPAANAYRCVVLA